MVNLGGEAAYMTEAILKSLLDAGRRQFAPSQKLNQLDGDTTNLQICKLKKFLIRERHAEWCRKAKANFALSQRAAAQILSTGWAGALVRLLEYRLARQEATKCPGSGNIRYLNVRVGLRFRWCAMLQEPSADRVWKQWSVFWSINPAEKPNE